MTRNQKIVCPRFRALELARQLGNVSQACCIMSRYVARSIGREETVSLA